MRLPLHILQVIDLFDGLGAIAMTWIPLKRFDSMEDMQIQFITLNPHRVSIGK
jgi:hypothetical protein